MMHWTTRTWKRRIISTEMKSNDIYKVILEHLGFDFNTRTLLHTNNDSTDTFIKTKFTLISRKKL